MSKNETTRGVGTRTIADAKAHFAECIREAEEGHAIVLTRHGRAVARLVPIFDGEGAEGAKKPEEVAEPEPGYTSTAAPASFHAPAARRAALRALLDERIWPLVPQDLLDQGVTKRQREEILGYNASTGTTATKATGRDRR